MNRLAPVKNYLRFEEAFSRVQALPWHRPKILLVHGHPGLGKTVTLGKKYVETKGILLRLPPGATVRALLKVLSKELRIEPSGSNYDLFESVREGLANKPRPIFVDEAKSFLTYDGRVLEGLRYIHDETGVPLVIAGTSGMPGHRGLDASVKRHVEFADRVSQWVKFEPIDLEDCALMANFYCSVQLEEDLLRKLHKETGGNCRRIETGLDQIAARAKSAGLKTVGLRHWEGGFHFLQEV